MDELRKILGTYFLSAKEADVVVYIMQGLANKEIASLMGITESGVKWHISSIYRKLPYKNRKELMVGCAAYTTAAAPLKPAGAVEPNDTLLWKGKA